VSPLVLEQCYYLLKFVRDHVSFQCSMEVMHWSLATTNI
jgi:hypothetical protein